MSDKLNEGMLDKRRINNRFKKYAKWMSETITKYRTDQNGLDAGELGKIGVYPFIEDHKKELARSHENARSTFAKVATPDQNTTTPAAISTACAILYEFFDKYVDAKKLLNDMGLSSIKSNKPDAIGIDAVRTMPESAYQRMTKLMNAYSPSASASGSKVYANLGMKQYRRLNNLYDDNVKKLDDWGKVYKDNFVVFTKKALTNDGEVKLTEKTALRLNDAIAKLSMAWNNQINLLKSDFPTVMTHILSSKEYSDYYTYLTTTILSEIGKPVVDYSDNTKSGFKGDQSVHVEPTANKETDDDNDIYSRLAASVEEPKGFEHVDEELKTLDEGLVFPGLIKRRGRKCVEKIKEMLDKFKNDEDGVSTKNVLKGLFNFRNEEKNVSIGVKPFVQHQIEEIRKDYDNSKTQFEKAIGRNFTGESTIKEDIEVSDPNANTTAAVVSTGSAIIYQFLEKYTNAQKILAAAGVDIDKERGIEAGAYEKFTKMLNVYNPKNLVGANSNLPQFNRIRTMYEKVVSKFENLVKGMIKNFEASTKSKLTEDGKKMSEDDLNKLSHIATVLEGSSEEKIELIKQDFSSVIKEIIASDEYQQYYNFITETVLPEMNKGVSETPMEVSTTPDAIEVINPDTNEENKGQYAYVFNMGVGESVSDAGSMDSSIEGINEDGDKKNEGPKSCVITVNVEGSKKTKGDAWFVTDDARSFLNKLGEKLIESNLVKEIKRVTANSGDSGVKTLVGLVQNAIQKFRAAGKPMPSHSGDEAINNIITSALELKKTVTIKEETPADSSTGAEDASTGATNNGAAQDSSTGTSGNTQAAAPVQNNTQPSVQAAASENSSFGIKYEIGKVISESGNDIEIHRIISGGNRTKNDVYTLSETAWGDGMILNPAEHIKNDLQKILEGSKVYSDIAKISKQDNNIRFEKMSLDESYRISMPRNRMGMLGNGNPLYECVALVEFDNTEERSIVRFDIAEVHKITK